MKPAFQWLLRAGGRWSILRLAIGSLSIFLTLIPLHTVHALTSCSDEVKTESGQLRGMEAEDGAICMWPGISYAAPPTGERRWRPPERPGSWLGAREANHFGPRCMQKGIMELANFDPSHTMDEDCLNLNVWAPLDADSAPVMVWFHGGGLYGGTGNTPVYHGDRLSKVGKVVVVTVNYRLNVFGFLGTRAMAEEDPNGSVGNYGLLDQIAALRWVRDNISSFGGNPDNVTIFGESAGGWSVCNLLASPLAAGLFHKGIIESGGCHAVTSLERAFEQGDRVEDALGCDRDDLECLRAVPAKRMVRKALRSEIYGMPWQPRADGYVLSGRPIDIIESGAFNNVPLIAGVTHDEASVIAENLPGRRFDGKKRYPKRLANVFGPEAREQLVELYPLQEYGRPRKAYGPMATEASLQCPTFNGLKQVAEFQKEAYLYRFDLSVFRFSWIFKTAHATELPFVFGNFDRWPFKPLYSRRGRRVAMPVSDIMMRYWTNFAHNGDPNGEGLPEWPAYGAEARLLVFDREISLENLQADKLARCDFWHEYYKKAPWLSETLGIMGFKPGRKYATAHDAAITEPR